MLRFIVDSIIIVSAFLFPWWVAMIFALIAVFYFTSYYEIVVLGIIIDSLYNASVPHFLGFHYMLTLVSIIVLFISMYIRERLRFYK
jgi:hypothetical protein